MRLLLFVVLCAAPFSQLPADDGVLEINQTCATGPGCFPGDAPGFPVTVPSGSYILTSDLVVPELVHGISTETSPGVFPEGVEISLDLNGFQISSTTTCTGIPPVCEPADGLMGYGVLIAGTDVIQSHGHVHHGSVRGMAAAGISCVGECVLHDLNVSGNGYAGIGGGGSTVRNVTATHNGQTGISADVIVQSSALFNGDKGFNARGAMHDNYAQGNGAYGYYGFEPGSVITGNVSWNDEIGVRCLGCTMQNNTINATTTGVDFENSAALYGGNVIAGGAQALLNSTNAVQTTSNLCNASVCP